MSRNTGEKSSEIEAFSDGSVERLTVITRWHGKECLSDVLASDGRTFRPDCGTT